MRFNNLDKLRGFAAISVVVYHVIEHTNWSTFPTNGLNVWWRIGWMGVDLFFVISGFVIYYSAHSIQEKYGANWGRIYGLHRLARIAPLYILTLLIFIILISPSLLFNSINSLAFQIITHTLFIHNLFPSTQGSINGVNWSIGVEMQFYVFIFLSFKYLKRTSPAILLAILCSVAFLWKFSIFYLFPEHSTEQRWFSTSQLPGTLDEFAFGIVASKIIIERKLDATFFFNKLWFRVTLAIIVVWGTLSLFWTTGNYWDSALAVVFFRCLTGLCGALLIIMAIAFPEKWPGITSLPFDYLGKISYGIYLWHLPVIISLKSLNLQPGSQFLIATLVSTLLLASFSYYMLERPWIKWAKTFG